MSGERVDVTLSDGAALAATRWRGDGPTVVLLHAGVADRRSWTGVADELAADGLDLVAHDRRGFGESPASAADGGATHLADLVELLDRLGVGRAFVVGNSMGGALALDLAVTAPERVAGVLLIGAAVSGMTDDDTPFDWTPDPASGPLMEALDEASGSGDVEAQVRLLAHLWLDGPAARSGRVTGAPPRTLRADERPHPRGRRTGRGRRRRARHVEPPRRGRDAGPGDLGRARHPRRRAVLRRDGSTSRAGTGSGAAGRRPPAGSRTARAGGRPRPRGRRGRRELNPRLLVVRSRDRRVPAGRPGRRHRRAAGRCGVLVLACRPPVPGSPRAGS
ncbi:alpha/beta fold hydrolase [Frigoribacterium sp. CFBP 13605]|nr:alpha/beta fold hydrolase [Frigoribacterium sp. CFBP 13605]